MSTRPLCSFLAIVASALLIADARADITDFTTWSLVEDPPNAFFSASVDSPSSITLSASDASGVSPGAVPAGTDIGYQSVDGQTAANSSSGFVFEPSQSFSVAVDYSASFAAAATGLSWGFGIGEDRDGTNAAGVVFVTQAGLPGNIPVAGPVGAAAAFDDMRFPGLVTPAVSASAATLAGSLHASWDAPTGDITVGWAPVGANSPTNISFIPGASISDNWTGAGLLVSFFLRSDQVSVPLFGVVSTPWTSGSAEVAFTNLRVTAGAASNVDDSACPCDLDGSGGSPDAIDYFAFLSAFFTGDPQADFDMSGGPPNAIDFFSFLNCFFTDCA